jgi:hypothetical protein
MTSGNGKRRPPRPRLDLVAPGASAEEAAAISAALEQFLHDTAPSIPPARASFAPWARAALAEGVGLDAPDPWGTGPGWGD